MSERFGTLIVACSFGTLIWQEERLFGILRSRLKNHPFRDRLKIPDELV